MDKADGAFLTIGELARDLGVAQHILRYWESRFPQLRPLQRSGNRRYYRPADVEVAKRINRLLNEEGFTVRGAQRVLEGHGETDIETAEAAAPAMAYPAATMVVEPMGTVHAAPAGLPRESAPQAELALGDAPRARRSRGQFDSSDTALLLARLIVIRENLREALGAH